MLNRSSKSLTKLLQIESCSLQSVYTLNWHSYTEKSGSRALFSKQIFSISENPKRSTVNLMDSIKSKELSIEEAFSLAEKEGSANQIENQIKTIQELITFLDAASSVSSVNVAKRIFEMIANVLANQNQVLMDPQNIVAKKSLWQSIIISIIQLHKDTVDRNVLNRLFQLSSNLVRNQVQTFENYSMESICNSLFLLSLFSTGFQMRDHDLEADCCKLINSTEFQDLKKTPYQELKILLFLFSSQNSFEEPDLNWDNLGLCSSDFNQTFLNWLGLLQTLNTASLQKFHSPLKSFLSKKSTELLHELPVEFVEYKKADLKCLSLNLAVYSALRQLNQQIGSKDSDVVANERLMLGAIECLVKTSDPGNQQLAFQYALINYFDLIENNGIITNYYFKTVALRRINEYLKLAKSTNDSLSQPVKNLSSLTRFPLKVFQSLEGKQLEEIFYCDFINFQPRSYYTTLLELISLLSSFPSQENQIRLNPDLTLQIEGYKVKWTTLVQEKNKQPQTMSSSKFIEEFTRLYRLNSIDTLPIFQLVYFAEILNSLSTVIEFVQKDSKNLLIDYIERMITTTKQDVLTSQRKSILLKNWKTALNTNRKEFATIAIEKISPKLNSTFFGDEEFALIYMLLLRNQYKDKPNLLSFLESATTRVSKRITHEQSKGLIAALLQYEALNERESAKKLLKKLFSNFLQEVESSNLGLFEELLVLFIGALPKVRQRKNVRKMLSDSAKIFLELCSEFLKKEELEALGLLVGIIAESPVLKGNYRQFAIMDSTIIVLNEENDALEFTVETQNVRLLQEVFSIVFQETKLTKQALRNYRVRKYKPA